MGAFALALIYAVSFAMGAETAPPQLRITSFKATGELTWTNSVARGFYSVERAHSPAGPWSLLTTAADLDQAVGNTVTAQVALTNAAVFCRVAWVPPDPDGIWDYYAYDLDGTLAVTGRFTLVTGDLESTNPSVLYRVLGTRSLGYAGPSSKVPWYLYPQVDTNDSPYCRGGVNMNLSELGVSWPTNCYDCVVGLGGDLWANTYTGRWQYYTFLGPIMGRFEAFRLASTNPITTILEPKNRREDGYDAIK